MAAKRQPRRAPFLVVAAALAVLLAHPHAAHADMVRGLMRIVGGLIELPRSTLAGTFGGPPIIGTLVGALSGALNGVLMVAGGTIETVASAVPLAAKLVPLIPVFF